MQCNCQHDVLQSIVQHQLTSLSNNVVYNISCCLLPPICAQVLALWHSVWYKAHLKSLQQLRQLRQQVDVDLDQAGYQTYWAHANLPSLPQLGEHFPLTALLACQRESDCFAELGRYETAVDQIEMALGEGE